MKVRCIDDNDKKLRNIPITEGKVYSVLGEINGCYMVINDNGEDGCYLKCRFEEVEEVEKEKVLEVEFQDVFDKVACRIKYQNEEVLKRGEFEDDEINVISVRQPTFRLERLYLRGNNKEKDNFFEIVSKYQAGIIKQKVDAINEKYGIPKRWRAKKGEQYWFINGCYFDIFETTDNYEQFDKTQYELGNYFKTKEEARAKLDKIKQILSE